MQGRGMSVTNGLFTSGFGVDGFEREGDFNEFFSHGVWVYLRSSSDRDACFIK
jgi:hypothetical protein